MVLEIGPCPACVPAKRHKANQSNSIALKKVLIEGIMRVFHVYTLVDPAPSIAGVA